MKERWLLAWYCLTLSCLLQGQTSLDDGVLPRGKSASPSPSPKPTVAEVSQEPNSPDCSKYLSNPESGEISFSQDGRHIYFLSRQPGEPLMDGKAFLYEVDLDAFRSKRLVSLKLGESAALVGHGRAQEAVTVLDFRKGKAFCGEGASSGITIKWSGKQKIIKSYPQSRYKIVATDQGLLLADLEQKNIKILDLNSFQRRTVMTFADKHVPLYLRLNPPQLTAFKPESEELLRFEEQDQEPSAVLKLKKGMRIVQDGELFGVVSGSEDGRTLQIKQIRGWSGEMFRGIQIPLPEGWTADKVGVEIDFRSGMSLLYGATPALRREWKQVLLYNGLKNQPEKTFKANEEQYFSLAQFSPSGKRVLLLSRNVIDDSAQSLKVGELVSGEWRDLSFQKEPSDSKADKESEAKPLSEKILDKPSDQSPDKVPAKLEKK